MAKVVGYVVALALLVAGLLAPAWLLWDDEPPVAAARAAVEDPEPTRIIDYDATFDLEDSGDLVVEEQVIVELPPYVVRTGITRYFDRVDDSDEGARRRVDAVSATLDGEPVPVGLSTAAHGRFDVARIGDPDVAVAPGEHRFVIRYRVRDPLEPGYGDSPSSLHWDVVPATWQQDIEQAEITVNLPAPARDVQCGVGAVDEPLACDDVTGQDTDSLVVRTGPLPAHTPVRLRLGVAAPQTDAPRLPWQPRYDVALGQDLPTLGAVLGGAVGAGLLGLLLARRRGDRHDRRGGNRRGRRSRVAATDAPPAGLGPAQAAYLLDGRTERPHYVASLVHAGQHGAVDVARRDTGWVVADRSGTFGWSGLDPVTSTVAHLLGGPGTSFAVDEASATSGERLASEIASLDAAAETWAREAGLVVAPRPARWPAVLVVAGLLAAGAAAVWNPFDLSLTGLVPGAFALALLPATRRDGLLRRTTGGRALRDEVAGFRRRLAATSDDERFDFTGREDRYAAYLPWAVALGCSEEWTDAYRVGTGHEPSAVPSAGVVADLDAAVAGAVAAYDAAHPAPGRRRAGSARSRRRGRRSGPR